MLNETNTQTKAVFTKRGSYTPDAFDKCQYEQAKSIVDTHRRCGRIHPDILETNEDFIRNYEMGTLDKFYAANKPASDGYSISDIEGLTPVQIAIREQRRNVAADEKRRAELKIEQDKPAVVQEPEQAAEPEPNSPLQQGQRTHYNEVFPEHIADDEGLPDESELEAQDDREQQIIRLENAGKYDEAYELKGEPVLGSQTEDGLLERIFD